MVDIRELSVLVDEKRPAGDDLHACRFAARNRRNAPLSLDDHGAHKSHVSPRQVGFGEPAYIKVHQPLLPTGRQHGGDRKQTQRRQRGASCG